MDDIVTDLNTARPITAGGTGGTSVISGWDGLAKGGTDIASASTINLTTATGPILNLTGNTTVTAVTLANQSVRMLRVTGSAVQFTASATLLVNGSALNGSFSFQNGELIMVQGLASGAAVWAIGQIDGARYAPGTLYGLTLSNNGVTPASKIDVAVGSARDSGDAANIDLLSALTAKDLASVWAVGSSAGLLDTGSVIDGVYHVYIIKRPDTGVVDVLASTSGASPTMPTNYTLKRRIGSLIRTGGSILAFIQTGDKFLLKTPLNDATVNNPGTSAVSRSLTVPSGVYVDALISVTLAENAAAAQTTVSLSSPDQNDPTVGLGASFSLSITGYASSRTSGDFAIRTNTRAIRTKFSASSVNTDFFITTNGWVDTRGRI